MDNSKQSIGSEGLHVEIDESKFGKRKYINNRILEGQCLFSGFCRESKGIWLCATS